jgi:hypothetical protein
LVVRTNASDTSAVRQNQSTTIGSALVTNAYDVNKDSRVNSSDTSVTRQNINPSILTFFTAPASLTLALEGSEFSVPPMAAQPVVTAEASESGSVEGLADEEWVQMYMGTAGESGEMFEGSDEISSVDEAVAEESDGSSLLDSVDAFFRDLSVSS